VVAAVPIQRRRQVAAAQVPVQPRVPGAVRRLLQQQRQLPQRQRWRRRPEVVAAEGAEAFLSSVLASAAARGAWVLKGCRW
jgi:hypothetical protein